MERTITKVTVTYDDGSNTTLEGYRGYTTADYQASIIHNTRYGMYMDKEEERYETLIDHLNMGVGTPNDTSFFLDQTGGGMTHAGWYHGEVDDPDKFAWVAIDDNNEGIMIGAYVGEDLCDDVYSHVLWPGTERNVEDLGAYEVSLVVEHARAAVAAVAAHLAATQARKAGE